MENSVKKRDVQRKRRVFRVRKKVRGTTEKPRMSVFKSNRHLSVQIIDDEKSVTLASASTLQDKSLNGKSKESAKKLGLDCESTEISIHRWRYASGSIKLDMGFIFNEDTKLGLCGDWLNGGRVEGAWLSGYQLASAMNHLATAAANS